VDKPCGMFPESTSRNRGCPLPRPLCIRMLRVRERGLTHLALGIPRPAQHSAGPRSGRGDLPIRGRDANDRAWRTRAPVESPRTAHLNLPRGSFGYSPRKTLPLRSTDLKTASNCREARRRCESHNGYSQLLQGARRLIATLHRECRFGGGATPNKTLHIPDDIRVC